MIHRIFTVYDLKSECYSPPFIDKTVGSAMRSFSEVANDPTCNIGKYPEDFLLVELGAWDDSKGTFNIHDKHVHLAKAIEVQRPLPPTPIEEAINNAAQPHH